MGSELLLFNYPGKNPESEPPTPSECFEEYQNALTSKSVVVVVVVVVVILIIVVYCPW